MNGKKILVPHAMLKGVGARNAAFRGDESRVHDILEAALRWLSDNPTPLTPAMYASLKADYLAGGSSIYEFLWRECQRRMFLEPEPEVPSNWVLIDLTSPSGKSLWACNVCGHTTPAPTKNHEHVRG